MKTTNTPNQLRCLSFVFLFSIMAGLPLQAAVIATESFYTTGNGTGGFYSNTAAIAQASNAAKTPTGTTGFGTAGVDSTSWTSQTSTITTNSTVSLTHSGLTGTAQTGSVMIQANGSLDRNSARPLLAAPPSSTEYFLSGLVSVAASNSLAEGDRRAMGFMDSISTSTFNLSTGFHLGVRRDATSTYLAAYANSTAYNLFDLSSTFGTT
jgi:hypothetical protein